MRGKRLTGIYFILTMIVCLVLGFSVTRLRLSLLRSSAVMETDGNTSLSDAINNTAEPVPDEAFPQTPGTDLAGNPSELDARTRLDAAHDTVQNFLTAKQMVSAWAVAVYDLDHDIGMDVVREKGSSPAGVDIERPLIASELINLWIMSAAYDKIEQGKISGIGKDGVRDYIQAMISSGDTDAADKLVMFLGDGSSAEGFKNVSSFAKKHGCVKTNMNHLTAQNGEAEVENYTTIEDCVAILRYIYGKYKDGSNPEMLEMLKLSNKANYLPEGMDTGIPSLTAVQNISDPSLRRKRVCHTVLLFTGDDQSPNYLICVMCAAYNNNPRDYVREIIAQIDSLMREH